MYELFARSHSLASISILPLVWFHVSHLDTHVFICILVSGSLLLLQKFSWLIHFAYRNIGTGPRSVARIIRFPASGLGEEIIQVRIDVKKSWIPRPGQFVYVSLPRLRSLGLASLEYHPFMVAWPIQNETGHLASVVLLVQARRGFTRRLQLTTSISALLDGPYGCSDEEVLGSYDKVLLLSCGVGLAAHLSTARYLLLAHNQQTARIRRLTLVWLLETPGNICSMCLLRV